MNGGKSYSVGSYSRLSEDRPTLSRKRLPNNFLKGEKFEFGLGGRNERFEGHGLRILPLRCRREIAN